MRQTYSVAHPKILRSTFFSVLLPVTVLLFLSGTVIEAQTQDSQTGRIAGKVVDGQTGEPLVGVNVFLQGTKYGVISDLHGNYTIIRIPPGTYTLVASIIGYTMTKLADVTVSSGEVTKLNISLKPEVIATEEIVVEARALRNTEAALLKERQKAAAVSDAISAEDISRAGSGDAAGVMSRVTGASLVEGKYVYIRGLGERYSTTQLNGSELPSPDPDKRAVPMDLFPSNLLDNIVTVKTFTPDKPGNFTGGSVNIGTKTFPESFTFSFSSSASYNTQTTLKEEFLTYSGGGTDWLGIDDGTRDIPAPLSAPSVKIPDVGTAYRDLAKARELDRLSKAFRPVMSPTSKSAPVNHGYSFSLGNQTQLFGHPFGLLGSLSYSRNLFSYNHDGVSARWQLTGNISQVNELTNDFFLSDAKSVDEVLWGGLVTLSYKPHPQHELGANYVYSRSGENVARFLSGSFPRDLSADAVYETRVLQFTERELGSLQFRGQHYFDGLFGMSVAWTSSLTNSSQDEPDLRFFTDNYTMRTRNGVSDTVYAIRPSIYPVPTRYYRNLDERNQDINLDVSIPFKQWNGRVGKVKSGGSYLHKERTFRERRFEFRQDKIQYNGNPEDFFSERNVGIVDSTNGRFRFGNYVVDATQPSSNYDGNQDISAAFGMVDLPLIHRLRFIGGVRFESTHIHVASQDSSLAVGDLSERDFLPSISLVYELWQDVNLRAAYGRTLARPTFRELVPYASFDFVGDYIFVGNEKLKRTLIDNYDLRWEWFARPGEIYAVSGFHKRFTYPIERVINPRAAAANPEIQYRNVDKAVVLGAEFEVRKRLDQIASLLQPFQVSANLSFVHSEVDIAPDELMNICALNPDASGTRQLQDQSPYVLNVDLAYDHPKIGTSASIHYNIFGSRLSEVSIGGTPDVFEQPRGDLEVTLSQRLWRGVSLKALAKNLLNSSERESHLYKDQEFFVERHHRGRSFSIGMHYKNEK
jgi:TonB-dependent receptor